MKQNKTPPAIEERRRDAVSNLGCMGVTFLFMIITLEARKEIILMAEDVGVSIVDVKNDYDIGEVHILFEWDRVPTLIESLIAMKKHRDSESAANAPNRHDWFVWSTAIKQGWLMLTCEITGATGSVRDPSQDEWASAFFAPNKPYRWHDESRVFIDEEVSK